MCEQTKVCRVCQEALPLTSFLKARDGRYGVEAKCKKCKDLIKRGIVDVPNCAKRAKRVKGADTYCAGCGIVKRYEDFYSTSHRTSGISTYCKVCTQRVNKTPTKEERAMTADKYRRSHKTKTMYQGAKERAKRRGLEFTIQLSDIVIGEKCPLLGIPMVYGTRTSPSLDRIDNTKGYVPGNVMVISKKANTMKSDATFSDLFALAENIHKVYGEYRHLINAAA